MQSCTHDDQGHRVAGVFCKLEEFTNWLTRYAFSTKNADDSAKNGESSVVGREFDRGKRPNIIILVLPPVACQSNCALPMAGTSDGDAISRCQVLRREGSVNHWVDL